MTKRLFAATLLFLWFTAPYSPVRAGDLFYDDFEDGNAADGSPVKWAPFAGFSDGVFDAKSGDFVLTSNTEEGPLVALADGLSAEDVSLRTQVRVDGTVDGIALFARFVGGVHTYQAGIESDGDVYIGWNDGDATYHNLAQVNSDLLVNQEDISLQFDVIGDSLKLFAWRSTDPMPVLPTVEVIDDLISGPGDIGLLYDPSSAGSGLFRFVESAAVPEPSGIALAGVALISLLAARHRTRRRGSLRCESSIAGGGL